MGMTSAAARDAPVAATRHVCTPCSTPLRLSSHAAPQPPRPPPCPAPVWQTWAAAATATHRPAAPATGLVTPGRCGPGKESETHPVRGEAETRLPWLVGQPPRHPAPPAPVPSPSPARAEIGPRHPTSWSLAAPAQTPRGAAHAQGLPHPPAASSLPRNSGRWARSERHRRRRSRPRQTPSSAGCLRALAQVPSHPVCQRHPALKRISGRAVLGPMKRFARSRGLRRSCCRAGWGWQAGSRRGCVGLDCGEGSDEDCYYCFGLGCRRDGHAREPGSG
eukprot:scaffold11154_cov101-Isochrysis_galbana.AAC.6